MRIFSKKEEKKSSAPAVAQSEGPKYLRPGEEKTYQPPPLFAGLAVKSPPAPAAHPDMEFGKADLPPIPVYTFGGTVIGVSSYACACGSKTEVVLWESRRHGRRAGSLAKAREGGGRDGGPADRHKQSA